jgi:hypothetical protein
MCGLQMCGWQRLSFSFIKILRTKTQRRKEFIFFVPLCLCAQYYQAYQ